MWNLIGAGEGWGGCGFGKNIKCKTWFLMVGREMLR